MNNKRPATPGHPQLFQSMRDDSKIVTIVVLLSISVLLTGFDNVILNSSPGIPAFQYAPLPG